MMLRTIALVLLVAVASASIPKHIQAQKDHFRMGDTNGDGKHSHEEMSHMVFRGARNEIFRGHSLADSDKDGKVSRSEYTSFYPKQTGEDFNKVDTNRDGQHSIGEVNKHSEDQAKIIARKYLDVHDQDADGQMTENEFLVMKSMEL